MTDVLNVSLREETGTKPSAAVASRGADPRHSIRTWQENVNLSVSTRRKWKRPFATAAKMVDLGGGVSEKALIRSVQWDAFGSHILHLDLNRVSATESVVVTVPLELRGEAPGSKVGGIVDHHLFDVEIECPAGEIPEQTVGEHQGAWTG